MTADVCWRPPDDQGLPAQPPFRSLETARSSNAYLAAVEQFRVEEAPRYLAGKGLTWCNRFVCDVTDAMGCPVPYQLANDMADWFLDKGAKKGWQQVDGAKAYLIALSGCPVVAIWKNTEPVLDARGKPILGVDGKLLVHHGHVAMVVPVPAVPSKPAALRIAQAGLRNFNNAPLASGFGTRPVEYFAHP